ncbi:MAG: phosphoribosyl-AMP cyclohydrolase [Acidobacteria bacterium]|nr:phosphoribosyl-AMP cyclohydrolase [Acidobacteriota bacterium]
MEQGVEMELHFAKGGGLLPAVIQEAGSGKVLMLGFMNAEALRNTLETGHVTFFSRSRNSLWVKGESSGHRLKVREVLVDCDLDSLVVVAEQLGPGTCHKGYQTCFYRRIEGDKLVEVEPRVFDPEKVYGGTSAAGSGAVPTPAEEA